MLSLGKTPRFLNRLGAPVDREEHRRIERVLATARVFLAFAAMVAIYLDPTEPTRYSRLAYVLLFAYIVYSAGVWAVLRRFQEWTPSFVWMHAVDMLFPAVFTLFTEGPNSPFFLFFVFVLTAAAFRWGFLETMLTSSIISVFILVEAVLLTYGRHIGTWLEGEYEINRLVIRLSYLLILGVLLGYLAETEKELRAENAFITRMIGKARVDSGLRGTMQGVLGETMRLFLAPRALAVLQQANSGRVFLWRSQSRANGENSIFSSEVGPEDRARYKVPLPASALFWEKTGLWGLGGDGRRARIDASWSPVALPQVGSAASILAVTLHMGEEWSGCLLLYDARTGGDKLQELRFAQKLFRQMGPAIYTVYLLRRLRSRAGAIERARVARELHDGAIQALIAVEMEVDVLRRGASRSQNSSLEAGLERVQEMLRDQVFDLRTLMQQMKPVEFSPSQLLDHMADVVERFRRDSGISAEFASGLEDVALSPRVCRELVRITQEALANVRKHSGAQRVLVRFGMRDSNWTLGVEDDGRGFAFAGKKFLSELDACREGPEIIKERVRVLGGQLEIESLPGKGTRLEVTFPQKAQATYV